MRLPCTVLTFRFVFNLDIRLRLVKGDTPLTSRGQLWDDPDVVFFSSATLLIALEMTGWSTEPRVWAWFDNPFANRMRRFGWNTDRVCASWFQYVGLAYCEITKAIFLEGGRYHQRRIWMLMLHVSPSTCSLSSRYFKVWELILTFISRWGRPMESVWEWLHERPIGFQISWVWHWGILLCLVGLLS